MLRGYATGWTIWSNCQFWELNWDQLSDFLRFKAKVNYLDFLNLTAEIIFESWFWDWYRRDNFHILFLLTLTNNYHIVIVAIYCLFGFLSRPSLTTNGEATHLVNCCSPLKGHGNEADFLGFLQKLVSHRSLTLPFEPFRFRLRIRGDIRNRKTTLQLTVSGSCMVSRGIAIQIFRNFSSL